MLDLETVGEVLVAKLRGELDLKTAGELRQGLDRALDGFTVRHLVLDLENVSFMDSTGLGVVLGRYKRLAGAGGKLVVLGLQPPVRRVLDLSGVLRIVPEFNTLKQAVEALRRGEASA
ncbi:MAG: anti-sigma F factor antagonist [Ammonifex sp.]|nr:MAG: anti-sigma F factor antagonist [Ammonifex sp.]